MIAALYVETGGVYYGLPDVDPWDETRDARRYAGPWPVVAHPPCARWCRLSAIVEKRWGHKRGDDGGTFAAALGAVRTWGGVLEHPAYSDAWRVYGLPVPLASGGWQRGMCGGWSAHIDQGIYGHRARKPTWLYSFGGTPPALHWGRSRNHTGRVFGSRHWDGVERDPLPARERSRTPHAFRDALLKIARSAA